MLIEQPEVALDEMLPSPNVTLAPPARAAIPTGAAREFVPSHLRLSTK
jgi:hypothetical protein